MTKKRVALVEIGGSHDECLLTQLLALRAENCELVLCTTKNVLDRNPAFKPLVTKVEVFDMAGSKSDRKAEVKRLWNVLKKEKVQKVVLNTAQGNWIRSLIMQALFSKIEFVGVIHTSRMFKESFTQKVISLKVKKYLVLSEFIKNDCPVKNAIALDYFYPIDFPPTSKDVARDPNHIVIIGGVERRRKDFEGFLKLASTAPTSSRWTFLGKSNAQDPEVRDFLETIDKASFSDRVTYYTEFVDQQQFVDTIASASCILPLVHPETDSADQYFKNQIPGAMNVALAFKIPLLIHEAYQHWTELKTASIYYNFENFNEQWETLIRDFETMRQQMQETEVYSNTFQQQKYARFVLGA